MLAAKQSGVPEHVIESLRTGTAIDDQKLAAVDKLTRKLVDSRGNPSRADVDEFVAAGYTEKHVLGIVLAISVKTLSNYSNHLFNSELDSVFDDYAWEG
jgi:high-affinity nickel permease